MSDKWLGKKSCPFDEGVCVFAYLKDCSGNRPSRKDTQKHARACTFSEYSCDCA